MDDLLITVIVASYNQGKYLDECLGSVFVQSYPNWDCVIIDDGSNDDSVSIAKKWQALDARFRVFQMPENRGISAVRNKGMEVAKGDYFQFLDADDILESNKILNQIPFCRDELIPVSGNMYFYHHEGIEKQRIIGKNGALPEVPITMWDHSDLLALFRIKNPFVVTAPLFPKSVKDRVGLINERLKAFEDWEYNFRCALAGYKFHHVGYAAKSQALIRLHPTSMTTNTKEMLRRRREFNFEISSNKDFQKHFGYQSTFANSPFFQGLNSLLRSFIPPIIFQLSRMFKGK